MTKLAKKAEAKQEYVQTVAVWKREDNTATINIDMQTLVEAYEYAQENNYSTAQFTVYENKVHATNPKAPIYTRSKKI